MKNTQTNGSNATPSATEFKQLIGLYQQGRLDEAVGYGASLTARYPDDSSLNNVLGVINARMGRLEKALDHYDRALSTRPDYAEVYNNRGNTLNRMARSDEAVSSFRSALKANPDYVEAHNNLGSALHDAGQFNEAITSYKKALKLKPDYSEAHNNLGNALMDIGRPEEALASFGRALQSNPGLPQAYNNIGNVLRTTGRHDEAIPNFQRAIQIWPEYAQAYSGLGNTLNDQGLHRDAIAAIRKALHLSPHAAATHNDLGNALSDNGQHKEAVESYRTAIKIDPEFAEVHSNLGNALCEFGDYEEAIESYSRALAMKPDFAEAHNNLSKNKKYNSDDPQFKMMLDRAGRPDVSENELMYLSFALGKAYEDIGDIEQSFYYLSQGNRLRKQELRYDIQVDKEHFSLIKRLFEEREILNAAGVEAGGDMDKQPIFIVGMPRSGTTLTEQILASHSNVFGAGELQAIGRLLLPVIRNAAVTGESALDPEVFTGLRRAYLDELGAYGDGEAFVTDKMPANFKWIGFLLEAMPGAKIINLQRDPAASCWSMFKLLFSGNGYTNDLVDLAEYYHLYRDLMDFWRNRYPNQIYDLNYESLTEDQERETRQLLNYCDLPWEDACLDFHKTKRAVRTPSGKQVRRKMYTGSSVAWRKYEAHLEPMLSVLNRENRTDNHE